MHAKKSLGQNFLVGDHYPLKIVNSVQPQSGETILEIGPGHGALTQHLIATNARVIAIELDRDLVPALIEKFSGYPDFSLHVIDALKAEYCDLIAPATRARVVANLPYYISTPILQRLLDYRSCIKEMTLMLQREVVERITADPGGKEYGYLSVLTQFYCETRRLFDVPPGAFRPVPKVHSSVVQLRVLDQPAATVMDETLFKNVISLLFAQRRKTIWNNLKAGRQRIGGMADDSLKSSLVAAQLDGQRRAETLSIQEMANLANAIHQNLI